MKLAQDDEALIAAALSGSTIAWEKLVKRYESRVYNYGLRLTGNASDALDLLQEVFLGVFRNLHKFRGDAQFSSWLFRIAHNKSVDLRRRKQILTASRRFNGDEDGDEDLVSEAPAPMQFEPEEQLGYGQSNQRIRQLLMSLSAEQQLVVELKIYQSLTFEEIAEMQDISENTAKTRYYNALKKLKASLERSSSKEVELEENHVMS